VSPLPLIQCWKSRLQLNDSNHEESYEGTQLGQIKYIVNCTEQTTEGIQATYMELLVRRAMKRVPGPISCLRLPGTLQHSPSLHLNLTIHRPPLCALHRLTSAHPFCLGCTHPRSRGCRERQLLARRIQGSQNGLRGGRDGPLVPRWAPRLIILVLCINAITEVELEFCLAMHFSLLILLSAAILSLKFSSLAGSPCCSSRPFLSALTLCLSLLKFRPTKPVIRRTSHLRPAANLPFFILKVNCSLWETSAS
jgi:hypothetical protein